MVNYLDKKVSLFQEECVNQKEVCQKLVAQLEAVDCVTPDFLDKVLERERIFPTGLQTRTLGIAIPHTDAIYAKHAQIAFMSLKNPVRFESMDGSGEIEVSLVFMLVLTKSVSQTAMLKKLMTLFQNDEALRQLYTCHQQEQVEAILAPLNQDDTE